MEFNIWSSTHSTLILDNCDRKNHFTKTIRIISFPTQFYASERKKLESSHGNIKAGAHYLKWAPEKLNMFVLTNSKAIE